MFLPTSMLRETPEQTAARLAEAPADSLTNQLSEVPVTIDRSEERRVGKECPV